jgi:hypothetical protein
VYDGRTEERNRLEYWLDYVKNYGGDSRTFIFVNERGKRRPDIPIGDLREQYGNFGLAQFSIKKDRQGLEYFRREIAAVIRENPSWNDAVPAVYFDVKDELESLFHPSKEFELTEIEHIEKIADKHKVQNTEILLKSLNSLGACLWHKDSAHYKTIVLNPGWISYGVYAVLNWAYKEGEGHATVKLTDFGTIFSKEADQYPKEKHRFIFDLMINYELAYEAKGQDMLTIPCLMPKYLSGKIHGFFGGGIAVCRYISERHLLPGIISRFIVRQKEEIDGVVWRHGVVLKDSEGRTALVEESDKEILIYVKEVNHKGYLNSICKTLNDIFDSYRNSKKPRLEYNLHMDESRMISPLWVDVGTIHNYTESGRPYYDCTLRKDIPLVIIMRDINMNVNAGNLWGNMGGDFNNVAQTYSDRAQSVALAEAQNPKSYEDFIEKMEKFLNSEKSEELQVKDFNKLKLIVDEAKKKDPQKGWEIIHPYLPYLSNGANIAKIVSAVASFLG